MKYEVDLSGLDAVPVQTIDAARCLMGEELPTQEQIFEIERSLARLPQADFSLINRFADGLYARQVTIKQGCLLTSKIHLKEHFAFILTGDISVWTDEDYQRVKAPQVIVTQPGTKRVLLAHEDTVWITVHACKATTVEEAEAELVSNDPTMIDQVRRVCPSG
jgi:quercetin dioxygenase-like cupin family protein